MNCLYSEAKLFQSGGNYHLKESDYTPQSRIYFLILTNSPTVHAFRAALKDYIIEKGFEIVKLRNEKKRVGAKCAVEGCTCYIYVFSVADRVSYKIKEFNS